MTCTFRPYYTMDREIRLNYGQTRHIIQVCVCSNVHAYLVVILKITGYAISGSIVILSHAVKNTYDWKISIYNFHENTFMTIWILYFINYLVLSTCIHPFQNGCVKTKGTRKEC